MNSVQVSSSSFCKYFDANYTDLKQLQKGLFQMKNLFEYCKVFSYDKTGVKVGVSH